MNHSDAYLLPKIDELMNTEYWFFSTTDLKSISHQSLIFEDKLDTTFEIYGQLYQYQPIPFAVTNEVICFEHIIDWFNIENTDIFAIQDSINICG